MNIVREDQKNLTSLLKVTVDGTDYGEAVEKTLRDYRRKANIPGFRPGMVPMGVVKKMYLKGVTAEQAYKSASEAAHKYIEDNSIDCIGDIIPGDGQKDLDFENARELEFVFEFALTPEVKIAPGARDKVAKYNIKISKDMRDSYRESYLRRYGRLVDVDAVEKEEALSVTLDNGQMNIQDAYVGLAGMGEKERKPFIGKTVGDVMDVDVNKLYPKEAQRAAVLQVKEEELAGIDPRFRLTITKIRKFAEPELNEEFFRMAFPDGGVNDAKGLEKFLEGQIAAELARETDYMLTADVRDFLVGKADLAMPVDFLRQWLYIINEGRFSKEDIDKDFDQFLDMMRWNVVQKHYMKTLEIKVAEEDMLEEAKQYVRVQLAQYGMGNAGDDMLANYAASVLQNKEEARKIYEKLIEKKVVEGVLPTLRIEEKSVSTEEFGKIVEEHNKK